MKKDTLGRILLTTLGTLEDLRKQRVELHEGMQLNVYTDDADDQGSADNLLAEGTVHYDQEARCWVLELNEDSIRHESDAGR
jgi:hypothetical protein